MTWLDVVLTAAGSLLALSTPFIVLYARKAAQGLAGLRDVTLTDEQLRQLDTWVTYAISFVEEQVRRRAKGLAASALVQTPEEKRQLAVKVARELAPDDLKGFSDKTLEMVIDAKVQDRRVSLAPTGPATTPSLPPIPPAARLPDDAIVTNRLKRP